jgi:galactose mutarotase-like enzyme
MEVLTQGVIGSVDGFATASISNGEIHLSVLPALGGKVISLQHLPSGREWMWKPEHFQGYFRSELTAAFEDSTLVGWDECLPTIAPCEWRGRSLPDHGEVWMSPCELDEKALEEGIIRTSLILPLSPLRLTRSLSLAGGKLTAQYRVENFSEKEEDFVWAMHPLFAMLEGDRLEFSQAVRRQLPEEDWIESLEFPEPSSAKCFADTPHGSEATVRNVKSGHGLTIRWADSCNPIFGLWLTRGGWHGHHHLALEPTNAKDDGLADAVARGCHGTLAPFSRQEWSVEIELF